MIAAIIQARMTSTRFPAKIMKEVMGRPLLDYMIERISFCHHINKVILATTVNKEDDPVVLFAKEKNLPFYRGSECDVLDRYYQASREYGVEHILRVTSDCPLIDPILCDHIVDIYIKSHIDFVHTGPTFAEGVDCEIFSFNALEKAWNGASLKSEREHITLYIHNHPELFKKITLINKTDDSKYRFTVDESEDFLVVKAIFEAFYRKNSLPFTTGEIKNFLDSHPDVYKLNAHIIRNEGLLKSLKEDSLVV